MYYQHYRPQSTFYMPRSSQTDGFIIFRSIHLELKVNRPTQYRIFLGLLILSAAVYPWKMEHQPELQFQLPQLLTRQSSKLVNNKFPLFLPYVVNSWPVIYHCLYASVKSKRWFCTRRMALQP